MQLGYFSNFESSSMYLRLEFVINMDRSLIHNVEDEEKQKMKINPIPPLEENPTTTFLTILDEVLYLKDIGKYLRSKFETIGEMRISREFEYSYNQDMSFKTSYEHLEENEIIKIIFQLNSICYYLKVYQTIRNQDC